MAFKRILCAVDFSETSLAAFREAIELARLFEGHLYVLHVIEARPVASKLIGADEVGEMAVELEEKATAAMDSLAAAASASLKDVPLTLQVTAGRAFAEILNYAQELSADLIVMGVKGANAIEQIVVGRTAELVIKDARCSTLLIRPA